MSMKNAECTCGLNIRKTAHKTYWIEYYLDGKRRRERIGPAKAAAEQRLREVLKARTEERYIDKDKAARTTLGELYKWYLDLPEVKAKKSVNRDRECLSHVLRLLSETVKISALTPGGIEAYQAQRLAEPSTRRKGKTTAPATVHLEVTMLKALLNRAVRHGNLDHNPIQRVKMVPVNNVRERVLTQAEFELLFLECAAHLRPIVALAYYSGMRKLEVLELSWNEVDFSKGIIRLAADRTKTRKSRMVPLHPRVRAMLERLPRALHTNKVFLFKGKPLKDIRSAYEAACRRAGLEDFTFHDLRHCAINNLRQAGNDYFKIMAISGHKTMSVFKRYNLVTEEELVQVKWADQMNTEGTIDTYMDTKHKEAITENL
jgi:integrase